MLIASLKKGESSDSYTDSLLRTAKDHLVLNLPATVNTLSEQRNRACQYAVDHGEDLLFVDSDMGWPSDAIDQLAATGLPVVGALCFGLMQGVEDGCGGYQTTPYPTVFDWRDGYTIRWDYPRNQLVRVAATGAAFLLIHRDPLEKVRAEFGEVWFDRLLVDGDLLGEDLSFCHRLHQLDIPVHVHTGVRTTHYKQVWVGEDYYIGHRLQQAVVRRRGDDLPAR